ncbi:DUF917 domain-containing protein [Saxibacter everestensis]|uniref:DUF917 domain-containing protein n=2 Tax=Saxibacter everestensis TaxID=2909229 RepID=A0ABY8R0K4_9MICO|nr:DUF917 domain-containing protein [Brevibacteriaceae bacterium ZFBP1038]
MSTDKTRRSQIDADCGNLARGAAILGTGGGGDPYIGRLLAEAAIRKHGPVPLVAVDDLDPDAVVIPVAMMGAPTVMVEKLASQGQFAQAVNSLARYLGVTPTHIACIEAGGVNSTIPIVAAAELGLPLIDGDGMGRAFPEIQMVLPSIYGVRATPMSICDEKGNSGIFDTVDNAWAERLARPATVEMGCSTIISTYAMSGAQVRESYVPGTLSLCDQLGAEVMSARAAHRDPVAAVAELLHGRLLAGGKVTDVERRTTSGFARGRATIEGVGPDAGRSVVLQFQNEHLLVELDGTAETSTPDLIMVLDAETAEPVTTESLRYGMRVRVVTAPSDPRWHSDEALALVGPRYFGYELDPVRFDGTRGVAA